MFFRRDIAEGLSRHRRRVLLASPLAYRRGIKVEQSFSKRRAKPIDVVAIGAAIQSEKNLKDYGDKLPADKKSAIENALNELKAAHSARNVAGIDQAMEKMNAAPNTAERLCQ